MTEREKNEDDAALWMRVAKTVKPLKQTDLPPKSPGESSRSESVPAKKTPESSPESPAESLHDRVKPPPPKIAPQPADLRGAKVGGISRNDARRITSGAIALTARLDLHGKTIDGAYRALKRFIVEKQRQQHRYVLVITGKGVAGQGALRGALPRWLETPPLAQAVVAYHPAQGRHGGDGAWYVQLRRLERLS